MLDRIRSAGRLACAAMLMAGLWGLAPEPAHATHNKKATTGSSSSGSGTTTSGSSSSSKTEMLVFDWNKPVTKKESGFPRFLPPPNNSNWKTPVNFAEGTYYFRVQIKKQPKPQNNRIQVCIWQDNLTRENCSKHGEVRGTPGNVVTWSQPISAFWKKNGKAVDYSRPREGNSMPIWNKKAPVSAYSGFNWAGENPDHWYPLDMRFTAVIVAKGATFSGWDKYIK